MFRGSTPLKRYAETGRRKREVGQQCLQDGSRTADVPMVEMTVEKLLN